MSYVICKEPGIQVDLMAKKRYQAQLVSYIDRMGCTYRKEVTIKGRIRDLEKKIVGEEEEWVALKDVTGKNGKQLGEAIGLFYSMDWQGLTEGKEDKFYILIHKARGKKHGGKNRKAAGAGSESGTGEGSAEAV